MNEAREQAKKQAQEVNEKEEGMELNTDENLVGTTHLNDPVSTESETEKLREELEDTRDKLLRKIAEFENFKRRNKKEKEELEQTAGKKVITDLLEVLDDCERAEKQMFATDNAEEIKEGVTLIFHKLKNTLTARGLTPMETIHHDFNPDLHEAITEIPAPEEKLKGKVIAEITKGYYLNDKIIRHAKVVVGK